jgi:hypothetical protein
MNGGEHQRDRLDGASEWGVRKTVYIYIYILKRLLTLYNECYLCSKKGISL